MQQVDGATLGLKGAPGRLRRGRRQRRRLPAPPTGRWRAEADAWFLALDAVPARVTFVALHRRLEVSIYTPAVSGGRKEVGSHTRRTFTLRLLHLIHPSLDFWNTNRLVPVLFPHRATHFPTKDLDLVPTWTVIWNGRTRCGRFFRVSCGPTTLSVGPPAPLLETRKVFAKVVTRIEAIIAA